MVFVCLRCKIRTGSKAVLKATVDEAITTHLPILSLSEINSDKKKRTIPTKETKQNKTSEGLCVITRATQWGHGMNQATRSHVGSTNHGLNLIHDHHHHHRLGQWSSPGPWVLKTAAIGEEQARSTVRRHGEERGRNRSGANGWGERVKPYGMPF